MTQKATVVSLIGQMGRGGSERQLYLMMRYLNPKRFVKHVIVFNPSPNEVYDDALRECGVNVWHIPKEVNTVYRRVIYLYRKFREIEPDIVHSWSIHDNPYTVICGLLARIPVRWGSARLSLNAAGYQSLPKVYRLLSLHLPSRVVVNSNELVQELRNKHLSSNRIIYLPNAVALDSADNPNSNILANHNITPQDIVIGTVGNLRHRKNQMMFVEALAPLMKKFDNLKGVIVGQEIPAEPGVGYQLKRKISDLNLTDRIFLTGFRSDITALLNRFSMFCLTSRSEGTPNALLEAMAAEKPVIATDVGGVPEVVSHEQNGLLVKSEDATGLSAAIERLLLNTQFAGKLSQAAVKTIESRYGALMIAEQLEKLYFEALGQ